MDLEEVLPGQRIQVETLLQLVQVHHPVHEPAAVLALDRLRGLLGSSGGQRAHDRLEDVPERHQPRNLAVLVDHQGRVQLAALELLEQLDERHRLRHEQRRRGDRGEVHLLPRQQAAQQRLGGDETHHVLEPPRAHGELRVGLLQETVAVDGEGLGRVHADDFHAGRHHRPHPADVEPQDVLHELQFRSLEHPLLGSLLHQDLDLLLRHRRLARSPHPEEPQDPFRGQAQQAHQGLREQREPVHRPGDPDRNGLRVQHRDALRHQLAHDQGDVRDDHHHQRESDALGVRRGERPALQPIPEGLGEARLTDGTEQDPDTGDPHLDGRQEARRLTGQLERAGGPRPAVLRHVLQTHAARGDDRELGHGEQSVQGDEQQEKKDFGQHGRGHLSWAEPPEGEALGPRGRDVGERPECQEAGPEVEPEHGKLPPSMG